MFKHCVPKKTIPETISHTFKINMRHDLTNNYDSFVWNATKTSKTAKTQQMHQNRHNAVHHGYHPMNSSIFEKSKKVSLNKSYDVSTAIDSTEAVAITFKRLQKLECTAKKLKNQLV